MEQVNPDEYYDGGDPEFDPNEINRAQALQKLSAEITVQQHADIAEVKPETAYEKLKNEYDTDKQVKEVSTTVSDEENPITKFLKIKEEINEIEKDIAYYKEHKELFKGEVPLEKSMDELQKLKKLSEFIYNSENYSKLKKIIDIQGQIGKEVPSEKYNIFNKQMYDKLNEHLLKRLEIINKLKADNPTKFKNVEYELYISPDTEKVKQFSKLAEIKQTLSNIEKKIGDYNFESKKKTIASCVEVIKNNLRLFDTDFQKEIKIKIEALTKRIEEIQNGKGEFYASVNKDRLDKLYSGFSSSKDVEDLIFNTISKMETLKNNHEESAFISLKIKELIEQQEKIFISINENTKILNVLKGNIKENVEVMKKNIQNIEAKLAKK